MSWEHLQSALEGVFLDGDVLAAIVLAAAYGIFIGAVPGLTATMAVALFIPFTYFLDTTAAIAAVVALEACAIFAGDIPATLVRIPGTPSSAAYTDDAYALTRAGRHQHALGTCLLFSAAGGLFGALVLIFLARPMASVALDFTYPEYFWLYLLGLSAAAIVSRGSLLKGALALLIGLLLSTVGLSTVHSEPRFTFGLPQLLKGIEFIPAMIGLFGMSEVLRNAVSPPAEALPAASASGPAGHATRLARGLRWLWQPVREVFSGALRRLVRRGAHALRSMGIGSVIGMLPGAGADIAAWISLAASKRFSRRPQEYGRGSLDGIADATAANSSALAGAWIPALVFGIPGDSVTALVIGVLAMKNVKLGPRVFEEQGVLVYSIYAMFIVANLALIPLGFLAIRAGARIVRIPRRVLLPCVVLFSIVGAYAMRNSYFDIGVMLAMGLLGFLLDRARVPLGPVVLGIVLGGPLEETFINSLRSASTVTGAFFGRPWAAVLGTLTIALWSLPLILSLGRKLGSRAHDTEERP